MNAVVAVRVAVSSLLQDAPYGLHDVATIGARAHLAQSLMPERLYDIPVASRPVRRSAEAVAASQFEPVAGRTGRLDPHHDHGIPFDPFWGAVAHCFEGRGRHGCLHVATAVQLGDPRGIARDIGLLDAWPDFGFERTEHLAEDAGGMPEIIQFLFAFHLSDGLEQ